MSGVEKREDFLNLNIEDINKIIPEGIECKQKCITMHNTFTKFPDFDRISCNQASNSNQLSIPNTSNTQFVRKPLSDIANSFNDSNSASNISIENSAGRYKLEIDLDSLQRLRENSYENYYSQSTYFNTSKFCYKCT